jgi:hypothetical protein
VKKWFDRHGGLAGDMRLTADRTPWRSGDLPLSYLCILSEAASGMSGRMLNELIDLTTMRPSKASRAGFTPTDLMWIVVVGAVPYLAREVFRYFLPGRPTVADQLKVLAELIAAAGDAKAKSLKVRISTDAKTRWKMPEQIQEAKILAENADKIDLEIVFA